MSDINDQIIELEKQIASTKYNKKTQHAIGLMKAQLSALREKRETRTTKKVGVAADGYAVRRTGEATVIIIGFPSVGKSTILNGLTNATSAVAAYAFTTLTVIPGVMHFKNAQIQILDVPGIVHGAASGRGRGKEVLSVMRSADMAMIIVDANFPEHYKALLDEIYETNIRINQRPPDVKIVKTAKGGITVATTVKLTKIDKEMVKEIAREFKIINADIIIREDIDTDQLIDSIQKNRIYMPALTVLNKIDMVNQKRLDELKKMIKPDICISGIKKQGIEELKEAIFKKLNFIKIYCKEAGKKADLNVPLIMFKNSTIRDMCRKLHKDFESKFKFARVWGKSAKFPGQKLMLEHKVMDDDIVEIHIR
jgi:hypothetical protein